VFSPSGLKVKSADCVAANGLKFELDANQVRWDGFRGLSYVLRRPGYCRPTHKPLRS
jgi:hypothetical protein